MEGRTGSAYTTWSPAPSGLPRRGAMGGRGDGTGKYVGDIHGRCLRSETRLLSGHLSCALGPRVEETGRLGLGEPALAEGAS